MTRVGYRGSGLPGAAVQRHPGAADRVPRDPRRESLRLRLTALAWDIGWEAARRMPERAAFAGADALGRLAWRVARGARQRVRANLSRVVPSDQLGSAVRDAFRSYARYWAELFRAADLDPDDLDSRTTADGMERLDAVLDEGGGAIVLLAHHGTWDIAAVWAESHGYHLAVVAEILRPRRLFAKFVRAREAVGLDVVPLRRGKGLVERLQGTLADNHLVGLLSDRDLSGRGSLVELFGEQCRLPAGPAVLARRTGSPVVPISMLHRPGRRWHLQVLEPLRIADLEVDAGMQQIAGAIERLVLLDPAQWHAFQPIWSADRSAGRRPDSAPAEPASARRSDPPPADSERLSAAESGDAVVPSAPESGEAAPPGGASSPRGAAS
ncbi:MAG TPA: phosphatidylinositol mannoside acyltransferase [Egibacteraceae bacterium]|nr:phosphatidylinositol mannoside acyltransferase [Egibacteraceae bacterium]